MPSCEASGSGSEAHGWWEKRLELADKEKLKGNDLFKDQEFEAAAKQYERAYKLACTVSIDDDSPHRGKHTTLVVSCLNNLATALCRLDDNRNALLRSQEVLKFDPDNEKALYRRAMCRRALGDLPQATEEFEELLQKHPTNKDGQKALRELSAETSNRSTAHGFSGIFLKPRRNGPDEQDTPRSRGAVEARAAQHAGIRNEGATCYLNTVLQLLYHIPAVRRLVYGFPTDQDTLTPRLRVVLALQRLFARMDRTREKGGGAVSATELMQSFGWDAEDARTQHDVGEMMSIVLEPVEDAILEADPDAFNPVADLFHFPLTYTDEVDQAKTAAEKAWRKERPGVTFPLTIENMSSGSMGRALDHMKARVDLIEGFNTSFDYDEWKRQLQVAVSRSDSNRAAECRKKLADIEAKDDMGVGKQVVRRTTYMRRAPPILTLRLQRIQFSLQGMSDYKLHSRFEFPQELDMAGYVHDPPRAEETRYRLYAVVSHIGSSVGGHYVCYVRPPSGNQWYKFDDDKVTCVGDAEAVDSNFGSGGVSHRVGPGYGSTPRSAYMVVYLRVDECSAMDNVTAPEHVIRGISGAGEAWSVLLPTTLTLARPTGTGKKGLRGAVEDVSVAGGEDMTAADLLRALRAKAPVQETPDEAALYAGDTARPALARYPYAPDLCLTLVKDHRIVQIFRANTPLWKVQGVSGAGLLRAEWHDVRTGVGCIRVAQAEPDPGGILFVDGGPRLAPHGDPWLLPLLPGDSVGRAVARLQRREQLDWDPRGPDCKHALIKPVPGREKPDARLVGLEADVTDEIEFAEDTTLVIIRKRPADGPKESDFAAANEARAITRARIRLPSIDRVCARIKPKAKTA